MPRSLVRLTFLAALVGPSPALAAHSAWTPAEQSQLRVLLQPPAAATANAFQGGIEIALDEGWYTYWRNPGDAGVPPQFDFSGSQNVESVEVLYPAPERHDDGTSVSLIYLGEVVFPLVIKVADPVRPVTLKVAATFGVCRDVCIPAAATAAVTLAVHPAADPLAAARLALYLPRVPTSPLPGRFDIEAATVLGDRLAVDVRMPYSAMADLFLEPPAGWYIGQPSFVSRSAGVSRYTLSLAGKPEDAEAAGQKFRFVAVAGGEAIQKDVSIR